MSFKLNGLVQQDTIALTVTCCNALFKIVNIQNIVTYGMILPLVFNDAVCSVKV